MFGEGAGDNTVDSEGDTDNLLDSANGPTNLIVPVVYFRSNYSSFYVRSKI